jgi:hypothetical protein
MMIFLVWIYGCGQHSGMEIMNIKKTKNNYAFLKMTKHSNMAAQKYKILNLGQANMNMQLVLKEWCNM